MLKIYTWLATTTLDSDTHSVARLGNAVGLGRLERGVPLARLGRVEPPARLNARLDGARARHGLARAGDGIHLVEVSKARRQRRRVQLVFALLGRHHHALLQRVQTVEGGRDVRHARA